MRLIASFAMVAILAVGAAPALSHQAPTGWDYPFYCCSGADCTPIAAETVREGHGGFIVTVAPGMTTEVVSAFDRRAPRRIQAFSFFTHPGP